MIHSTVLQIRKLIRLKTFSTLSDIEKDLKIRISIFNAGVKNQPKHKTKNPFDTMHYRYMDLPQFPKQLREMSSIAFIDRL